MLVRMVVPDLRCCCDPAYYLDRYPDVLQPISYALDGKRDVVPILCSMPSSPITWLADAGLATFQTAYTKLPGSYQ